MIVSSKANKESFENGEMPRTDSSSAFTVSHWLTDCCCYKDSLFAIKLKIKSLYSWVKRKLNGI